MPLLIFLLHAPQQRLTMLFNGSDNPQNCPFSLGDLDAHLIRGTLVPPVSTFQPASRSVQSFLQSSRTWPTDRHTDRHTDHAAPSVALSRIWLMLRCGLISGRRNTFQRTIGKRTKMICRMFKTTASDISLNSRKLFVDMLKLQPRWLTVWCDLIVEHSRVRLGTTSNVSNSDYINANTIVRNAVSVHSLCEWHIKSNQIKFINAKGPVGL